MWRLLSPEKEKNLIVKSDNSPTYRLLDMKGRESLAHITERARFMAFRQ